METLNLNIHRAADAALNRALEGIRVCEDAARFLLADFSIAKELKALRHQTAAASAAFSAIELLAARDTGGDINKFHSVDSENTRDGIASLLRANMRRAAEAARTLEEIFKISADYKDKTSGVNPFKKIRFAVYDLEKRLLLKVGRTDKTEMLKRGLYAILDSGFVEREKFAWAAQEMISGGASVIQLRMKNSSQRDKLRAADELSAICRSADVLFIVNDDLAVAAESGAGGVHLGQDDLPCLSARKFIAPDAVIGTSNHAIDDARDSIEGGADYLAVGPVYGTSTKTGDELAGIGFDLLKGVRALTSLPIVAIGGITISNAADVIMAGADSIAVISALYSDNNIRANCAALSAAISGARKT